jgi:hypothetical protein
MGKTSQLYLEMQESEPLGEYFEWLSDEEYLRQFVDIAKKDDTFCNKIENLSYNQNNLNNFIIK